MFFFLKVNHLTVFFSLQEHIGECSYEDQNCLACDALVQRRHLEMHQNDSCPKRIIECAHCQDEYTFIEKQASIRLSILEIIH